MCSVDDEMYVWEEREGSMLYLYRSFAGKRVFLGDGCVVRQRDAQTWE